MKPRRTYDWKWTRLSRRHLAQHPTCAVSGCGKRAELVDHIVNVKVAPWRRLDPSNLQSLCWACHNRLTRAYDLGSIRGACDQDGNPLDPSHPWAMSTNAEAIRAANTTAKASPIVAARLKQSAVLRGNRR